LTLALLNIALIIHLIFYGELPFGLANWILFASFILNMILFMVEYRLRWGKPTGRDSVDLNKTLVFPMIIGFIVPLVIAAVIIAVSIFIFSH
jgi:hypothetical protein